VIPESYAVGNGDLLTYSETSAFWTFSFVSNFSYLRYNLMMEDVRKVQTELERKIHQRRCLPLMQQPWLMAKANPDTGQGVRHPLFC
jgi:dipeptidase